MENFFISVSYRNGEFCHFGKCENVACSCLKKRQVGNNDDFLKCIVGVVENVNIYKVLKIRCGKRKVSTISPDIKRCCCCDCCVCCCSRKPHVSNELLRCMKIRHEDFENAKSPTNMIVVDTC